MAANATYDPATDIGKVRLHIPDRDTRNPMFSDVELEILLQDNRRIPLLAAAAALDIIAGDAGMIRQYSRGGVSTSYTSPEVIAARAERLRRQVRGATFDVW